MEQYLLVVSLFGWYACLAMFALKGNDLLRNSLIAIDIQMDSMFFSIYFTFLMT